MLKFGVVFDENYVKPIYFPSREIAESVAEQASDPALLVVGNSDKPAEYVLITSYADGDKKPLDEFFSNYTNHEHTVRVTNKELNEVIFDENYDTKTLAYDAREVLVKILTALFQYDKFNIDIVITQFNVVVS